MYICHGACTVVSQDNLQESVVLPGSHRNQTQLLDPASPFNHRAISLAPLYELWLHLLSTLHVSTDHHRVTLNYSKTYFCVSPPHMYVHHMSADSRSQKNVPDPGNQTQVQQDQQALLTAECLLLISFIHSQILKFHSIIHLSVHLNVPLCSPSFWGSRLPKFPALSLLPQHDIICSLLGTLPPSLPHPLCSAWRSTQSATVLSCLGAILTIKVNNSNLRIFFP